MFLETICLLDRNELTWQTTAALKSFGIFIVSFFVFKCYLSFWSDFRFINQKYILSFKTYLVPSVLHCGDYILKR